MEGGEEDPEAALAAPLVGPQPDHAHRVDQHDVVGHRRTELVLQVLHRAAAVIDGHEVALALVGVVHLVLQETQVDLGRNKTCVIPCSEHGAAI